MGNCGVQKEGKTRKTGSSWLVATLLWAFLSNYLPVKQKMWTHLALFSWMTIATSGSVMRSGRSVVMTKVERVCSGSAQCLLLSNLARKGQARHTADYQTTPVWFLWQLPHGLLSTIFAPKGRGRWRKPRGQCRCELKDKS